jgi:Helix-loop-helix DNA-binding domain
MNKFVTRMSSGPRNDGSKSTSDSSIPTNVVYPTGYKASQLRDLQTNSTERLVEDSTALDNASALLGLCRATLGRFANLTPEKSVSDVTSTAPSSNGIKTISDPVKNGGSNNANIQSLLTSVADAEFDKSLKRKYSEDASYGHLDDNDEESEGSQRSSSKWHSSSNDEIGDKRQLKPKKYDRKRREERNKREKLRSSNIAKQITELRDLLTSGGVTIPKGTKGSVLSEAANYIKLLQRNQTMTET